MRNTLALVLFLTLALFIIILLAGCATPRAARAAMPDAAAAAMRADAVRQLAQLFPPEATRFYLDPQADALQLGDALRSVGFAVARPSGSTDVPGYVLVANAMEADAGLYTLSLRVGSVSLGRAYATDGEGVFAAGAWTVDASRASAGLRERVAILQDDPDALAPDDPPAAPATVIVHADPGSPEWKARLRVGPEQRPELAKAPASAPMATTAADPAPLVYLPPAALAQPPLPPRLRGGAVPAVAPMVTPAPARPAPGAWRVQLGAYAAPADAAFYARDLLRRHNDVLAGAQPFFTRLGRAEPRIVLKVGPYASRGDAVSVCQALRRSGGECIVIESSSNG